MFDLEAILKQTLRQKKPPKPASGIDLARLCGGRYLDKNKRVLLLEKKYVLPLVHGSRILQTFQIPQVIKRWAKAGDDMHLSELLFYDTETTGLSGGVGTWVFLTGIGFFQEGHFVVQQYFMMEPAYEDEYLDYIYPIFEKFKYPVSFNGRSYDSTLLDTRFIMNGREPVLSQKKDIDLLYLSRRLWRRIFSSCSLNNLEEQLMGLQRSDSEDLPSGDIPQLYFDFIENQSQDLMANVFNHNCTDILSMPVLLRIIIDILAGEDKEVFDQRGAGSIYEDQGDAEQAEKFYLKGLKTGDYQGCGKQLSFVYKRQKNWIEACRIWENTGEIYAQIELAKYHEHVIKDFEAALECTETALDQLFDSSFVDGSQALALQKRKNRILNKIARNSKTADQS